MLVVCTTMTITHDGKKTVTSSNTGNVNEAIVTTMVEEDIQKDSKETLSPLTTNRPKDSISKPFLNEILDVLNIFESSM